MPVRILATSHCSVLSVFIIPFLGHFRQSKTSYICIGVIYLLKEYPCVTMNISTSAVSRTQTHM
jgi:hypothetical protein